jgi:acetyl-CoA carboxylase beta subunit
MAQLEFIDQEIMLDPTKRDNASLIRCEDEECGGVSFRHEIQMNNWRCPYCGMSVSKPQRPLHQTLPDRETNQSVPIWLLVASSLAGLMGLRRKSKRKGNEEL